MKKCSKSAHESLTELNITPLLDLGFVLLVIFIITTIPPVKDMDLKLPTAAKHEKDPPRQANYITVEAGGKIWINKKPADLAELQTILAGLRAADPGLSVIVRGDGKARYRQIRGVLDACQQANIVKVDLATETTQRK